MATLGAESLSIHAADGGVCGNDLCCRQIDGIGRVLIARHERIEVTGGPGRSAAFQHSLDFTVHDAARVIPPRTHEALPPMLPSEVAQIGHPSPACQHLLRCQKYLTK